MSSPTDYLEKVIEDLKYFKSELAKKMEEVEKRLKALESN